MPPSLHVEALAWLRYSKHMPLVCTEAGYWNADVLGIDDNKCIEIEVKKSRSDFLNDFRAKERKHATYANLKVDGRSVWSPAFFWYFVPADLGESCLKTLDELGIKHAGLAILDRPSTEKYGAGRNVSVLRRAPRLHKNKPHPKLVRAIQLRMGSELTTLRLSLDLLKKVDPEQVAAIVKDATALARQLAEAPDWETISEETTSDKEPVRGEPLPVPASDSK